MKAKVLLQKDVQLKIEFQIQHSSNQKIITLTSEKYLCGAVYFQLQVSSAEETCVGHCKYCGNNPQHKRNYLLISVRSLEMFESELTYKCRFSSVAFNQKDVSLSLGNTWHQVFKYYRGEAAALICFDVAIQLELASATSPLASLYEDTELTDFELCGEDGSISVHSVILAGLSPYFKTIFCGKWKETSEGHVTVTGTTKETLEQFKAYIYLNKLPDTGVQQLLVLGSYYMMPELVQKCLVKLLHTLNAENLVELIEFAVKYKVTKLLMAILNIVQNGMVNISIRGVSTDNEVPSDRQNP